MLSFRLSSIHTKTRQCVVGGGLAAFTVRVSYLPLFSVPRANQYYVTKRRDSFSDVLYLTEWCDIDGAEDNL
jgi:hypothetical protein